MEDPSQVEKLGVMKHLNSYKLGSSRYSPAPPQRSTRLASEAYQESFRNRFKKVSLEGTRRANQSMLAMARDLSRKHIQPSP